MEDLNTARQNGAERGNILMDVAELSVPRPSRRARNRSRVSNGREYLPGVDQRLAIARRYRDLVAQIAIDQGGADRCSETRLQLIRRFASGTVLAEALRGAARQGANRSTSPSAPCSARP